MLLTSVKWLEGCALGCAINSNACQIDGICKSNVIYFLLVAVLSVISCRRYELELNKGTHQYTQYLLKLDGVGLCSS